MPSLGPFYASQVSVLAAGFYAWQDISQMLGVPNGVTAWIARTDAYESVLQLAQSDAAISDNKSNLEFIAAPIPAQWYDWTGDSTFWGIALTPALLNDPTFAIVLKWADSLAGDANASDLTLIKAFNSGSGLGVPSNATAITISVGVLIGVDDPGNGNIAIDAVRLNVTSYLIPSAAITGTATASITEADPVSGGKTTIITLTNDTWVAAGATFDAQRQAIINGCDSAQAEATGWDAVVKALQGVAGVVRTSDTIVTITWDAQATYDITATETITVTVPSAALTGAGGDVVATPTFTIDPVLLPTLAVTGIADDESYAFGNVTTGDITTHQFTITNTGEGGDVLGTISVSGTGFSIDAADDPSGDSLAASGTTTVTIIANFATAGAKTGILTIPSNDAATPYVINLTATALAAGPPKGTRSLLGVGF